MLSGLTLRTNHALINLLNEDEIIMPSNAQLKLFTNLLNISDVKVIDYVEDFSTAIMPIVASNSDKATCPHCGKVSRSLHENNWSLIKDLPISGQDVFWKINRRQFNCKNCSKTFSERLSYCRPQRNYTKRLTSNILNQVKDSNVKSVAEKNGVTEAEIETMLSDLKEDLVNKKPEGLKKLGIDEISSAKGHQKFSGVLVDLDTSKLLALVSDRTQEAIEKVLLSWGKEVLEGIEEVSIDLWKPYQSLAQKNLPNASVVADRFHVMNQVQTELNDGRKPAKKEVNKMPKFKVSLPRRVASEKFFFDVVWQLRR